MRRLKKAKITHISLCPRGKNGLQTLWKSDDGTVEVKAISKGLNEDGELLAVVYAPNRPDADNDFASALVIKEMAHEYNRDHRKLDIKHDGVVLEKEAAYLAESFIVAKGDERFLGWTGYDGQPAGDLTGAWAVLIKIEDQRLQKAYREGEWAGVSMFGTAAVEEVDNAEDRIVARMLKELGKERKSTMDKEQFEAMLAKMLEGFTSLGAKIDAAKVAKSEGDTDTTDPKPDEVKAPVFKGSMTNPDDVKAFSAEMRSFTLQKEMTAAVASGDSAKIDAVLAKMAEGLEKQPTDEECGVKKEDTPEVSSLRRQLHKALQSSSQTVNATTPKGDDSETVFGLQKSEEADFAAGIELAKAVNKSRGLGE